MEFPVQNTGPKNLPIPKVLPPSFKIKDSGENIETIHMYTL